MISTGIDVQLSRDAGLHEPRGERDVLIPEQVDGADVDEGRRQAGQVVGASLGGVLIRRRRRTRIPGTSARCQGTP